MSKIRNKLQNNLEHIYIEFKTAIHVIKRLNVYIARLKKY